MITIINCLRKFAVIIIGMMAFLFFVGVAESTSFEDFCARIGYGVVFSAVAWLLNKI